MLIISCGNYASLRSRTEPSSLAARLASILTRHIRSKNGIDRFFLRGNGEDVFYNHSRWSLEQPPSKSEKKGVTAKSAEIAKGILKKKRMRRVPQSRAGAGCDTWERKNKNGFLFFCSHASRGRFFSSFRVNPCHPWFTLGASRGPSSAAVV